LKHILKTTSAVLGVPVKFVSDCIGQLKNAGSIKIRRSIVLKTRFHSEEEAGCCFAKQLALLEIFM
jgi:phosphoglycerate kinase